MGIAQTRVMRADGRVFAFTEAEAQKYVAANPGSKVVKGRNGEPGPTAAEVAATAAVGGQASGLVSFPGKAAASGPSEDATPRARVLSDLKVDELKALAEKHGIAVPDGPRKAIFDVLKKAKVKPEPEAEEEAKAEAETPAEATSSGDAADAVGGSET